MTTTTAPAPSLADFRVAREAAARDRAARDRAATTAATQEALYGEHNRAVDRSERAWRIADALGYRRPTAAIRRSIGAVAR